MIVFDFQRPINRYNVDNDYNYREELVEAKEQVTDCLFVRYMVAPTGGPNVFP